MHIVSMSRFIVGLLFLLLALACALPALRERGFGKFRQLAALSLFAAAVFVARGLGLVDF